MGHGVVFVGRGLRWPGRGLRDGFCFTSMSLVAKIESDREGVMKIVLFALPMILFAAAAGAENIVPPEVVQLENVKIDGDMKMIYVGNNNKHFTVASRQSRARTTSFSTPTHVG